MTDGRRMGARVPGCEGAGGPGCRGGSSEAGFSLIELLVSAAIMLTVTGAIFSLMTPAPGTTEAQTEVADMQQRARLGADVLFKELIMTGAGIYQGETTGSLINFFAPILPRKAGLLYDEGPTTAIADAITLMYVPNEYTQTTISHEMPIQSPEMKLHDQPNCPRHDGLCGFDTGMVVMIFDETGHFDTFEITQVQGPAAHLQHRGQRLSYKYPEFSQVTQIVSNSYYRKAATNQLMRYNGGLTDTPIVDNLVDMNVSYFGKANPPKPPLGQANCLYDAAGLPTQPELAVLPLTDGSLAELPLAMLKDGPVFCGSGSNEYDADLLRVLKVRVMLRMQVASAALRGSDATLWKNPGTSRVGAKSVPDYTVTFEVAPRNLNLAR